jgi:hypothetical protein
VSNEQQPQPSVTGAQEPTEPTGQAQSDSPTSQAQPSEEELRAAYEAELNRITSAEMIIQTTVSLINIAGRRLGLAPSATGGDPTAEQGVERDLEQVRDAIDGATALMPILERRMPSEMGPLRDAIAQLRFAYAREAQSAPGANVSATTPGAQSTTSQPPPAEDSQKPADDDQSAGQGPAQASGRLWVPGR